MAYDANDLAREFGVDALRAAWDRAAYRPAMVEARASRRNGDAPQLMQTTKAAQDTAGAERVLPMSHRRFDAAELQNADFPPINWIVPDLLPEGASILAGKPKLGKSWLALDVALAVASGGTTLGRQCNPGPVLYLALEDNPRRLQRRLARIEPHVTWPAALQFQTQFSRLDAGGLEQLREWLGASSGARLIIVDTLAVVRPQNRASESTHSSDYHALRGLHQIANEFGIAVLVIHHLRKTEGEDPFDAVSGSTGLTGAADATLILTRREQDGGVVLYGRGRDLEEVEIGMEFDPITCRWRDLGDPAKAFAPETRSAIIAAVEAGHQTPAAIREFAGLDHELVKKTLQRMARAGDLRKTGRGHYEMASDPLSPQSPCPRSDDHRISNGDKGTEGTGVEEGEL